MRTIPLSMLGIALALAGCGAHQAARPASAPSSSGVPQVAAATPQTAPDQPVAQQPVATAARDAEAAPEPEPDGQVFQMFITGTAPAHPACDLYTVLTPTGIAIQFTGRDQPVDELRKQVRGIARQLEEGYVGPAERRMLDNAATFGMRSILALHPTTTVMNTADGARLQIDARNPRDVTALRAHVLWHSADFLPGVMQLEALCPMLPGAALESANE